MDHVYQPITTDIIPESIVANHNEVLTIGDTARAYENVQLNNESYPTQSDPVQYNLEHIEIKESVGNEDLQASPRIVRPQIAHDAQTFYLSPQVENNSNPPLAKDEPALQVTNKTEKYQSQEVVTNSEPTMEEKEQLEEKWLMTRYSAPAEYD